MIDIGYALGVALALGAAVAMILLTVRLRPTAAEGETPATHRVGLVDEDSAA